MLGKILLGSAMMGCMAQDMDNAESVRIAVEQRDPEAVRVAVAAGRGIDERNDVGATPLITAVSSGQFVIAEMLVDGGADIFAADRFGLTAAHLAAIVPFPPGTVEGDAKQRVLAKLRQRGMPQPPPPQTEVLRMIEAGEWPPHTPRASTEN